MTSLRTFSTAFRRLSAALEALAASATNQATNIAAINAKTQRFGVSLPALAAGATDVPITWPVAWPDTAYGVWISVLAGTGTVVALHATLKAGSKTEADCVITIVNSTANPVATGIDVLGVRT